MIRAAGWRVCPGALGVIPGVQYLTVSRLGFHATRLKSFRSGRCGWNPANLSARKTGRPESDRSRSRGYSRTIRGMSHDRPLTIPEVDLTSFDSGVLKSVTVTQCQLRALRVSQLFHPSPAPPFFSPPRRALPRRRSLAEKRILIMSAR